MGRKKEDETPEERAERKRKQNLEYKKRASKGWKHPKDKRGKHRRVIQKFKKGPFHNMFRRQELKRDAGFPTVESWFSFREWIASRRDT